MRKSAGNPPVESTPGMGRTVGNMLVDSDVEIRPILALPTPPSTKRKVAANFASTELAGAQKDISPAQTNNAPSAQAVGAVAGGVEVIFFYFLLKSHITISACIIFCVTYF